MLYLSEGDALIAEEGSLTWYGIGIGHRQPTAKIFYGLSLSGAGIALAWIATPMQQT
jgi:hypothetical protein